MTTSGTFTHVVPALVRRRDERDVALVPDLVDGGTHPAGRAAAVGAATRPDDAARALDDHTLVPAFASRPR